MDFLDWWVMISFESNWLLSFKRVKRIATIPSGLYFGHGSNNWFCRKIAKFLCYLIFRVIIIFVFVWTCKYQFLCIVNALLMVPRLPTRFIIRTVTLYFEFYFVFFCSLHLLDYIGEFFDSFLVLSFDDKHKALYCFPPALKVDLTDLPQLYNIECFIELMILQINLN